MLLRLLFPSWAFFDAVTDVPSLEVRTWSTGSEPSAWRVAAVAPVRRLLHLLFNPEGNEQLAVQSVVDRFAVERETGIDDEVTRALVEQIAARAVCTVHAGPTLQWQWRVGARSVTAGADAGYRLLYESALLTRIDHASGGVAR